MAYTDYLSTVEELYIAYYQRPADPDGLVYWAQRLDLAGGDLTQVVDAFANSEEAKSLYGEVNEDTIGNVIDAIYQAAFNRAPDEAGKQFYIEGFKEGRFTPATIMLDILNGAQNDDKIVLDNKLESALNFTKAIDPELDGQDPQATYDASDIANARAFLADVTNSPDSVKTVDEAKAYIQLNIAEPNDPINHYTLTADTDGATAHVFEAPMVNNPEGSDRIMSLQDEDKLTGLPGSNDNVLNVVMGHRSPAETGTVASVTPTLENIQILNADWTGDITTLDLRYADSLTNINVNKITNDATAVRVQNISTLVPELKVANAASPNVTVTFDYQGKALGQGDNELHLNLDNVLAAAITQTSDLGTTGLGFKTVDLNATNGVELNTLSVNQMQNLTITGDNDLTITTLLNPGAFGLVSLDASQFTGDLTIDISPALGGFVDPANSGQIIHGTVTGGSGDDTFITNANIAATTTDNRDVIDGGEGDNSLVFHAATISGDASISNIQTLELRMQPFVTVQTVDFDAFDDSISKVIMRDENPDGVAGTFNLNDLPASLAENGLTLRHSVTEFPGTPDVTVNATLKDASGTDDTVAITVENDENTTLKFDYNLNFTGNNGSVENVVINDNDTEDNVVSLLAVDANGNSAHTGTITLTGGSADTAFTITTPLVASVIDASAQKSDLTLTVGQAVPVVDHISQQISLGSGDDMLIFRNADDFDSSDKLTDNGGEDTVRAFYDKIQQATPDFSGIEKFETAVANNTALDMSKTDIQNLIILSDVAAATYGVVGVGTTDTITLQNSQLTGITFSSEVVTPPLPGALNFNGVTLTSNPADNFTVDIKHPYDTATNTSSNINIGQLTTHDVKDMNIQVGYLDNVVTTAIPAPVAVTTTINNIYDKNLEQLHITKASDMIDPTVILGTVSGNATNDNLKVFDSSDIDKGISATVICLGDNAQVTLGDGNDIFSAIGSSGKNIVIDAGEGNNIITGSAQADTIHTDSGNDLISADRGDNVVTSGAGNDIVFAKDGNDTINLGSGFDIYGDNIGTNLSGIQSTNTVIKEGGVAVVLIDVNGNGMGAGDIEQMIAVGEGSTLTISWTGSTLQTNSAVLDGYSAQVDPAAPAADDNANLVILTSAGPAVTNFDGKGGNDVILVTDAAKAINVSGGEGNDAMVGGGNSDVLEGGAGADKVVLQNTYYAEIYNTNTGRVTPVGSADGMVDTVKINDGDSTITSWDKIVGFDTLSGPGASGVVAGSATPGSDVLDLPGAPVIAAPVGPTAGISVGNIAQYSIGANGMVSFFDTTGTPVTIDSDNLNVALNFLAQNITTPNEVVAFQCDMDNNGVLNQNDATFIFENGIHDNIVELMGVYNGVEMVGGGTAGVVEIS